MSGQDNDKGGGRQVAERGILFNGPMVRAILDDRKTETRRTNGLDRINECPDKYRFVGVRVGLGSPVTEDRFYAGFVWDDGKDRSAIYFPSPFGRPGDLLYVRETWGVFDRASVEPFEAGEEWTMPFPLDYALAYKATDEDPNTPATWVEAPTGHRVLAADDRWRPSIHMPKWAARIWLRVEDVWVERLQEITAAGCAAEGFAPDSPHDTDLQLRMSFEAAWDEINGKHAPWSSNPWVWVVRFSRTEAPHA